MLACMNKTIPVTLKIKYNIIMLIDNNIYVVYLVSTKTILSA